MSQYLRRSGTVHDDGSVSIPRLPPSFVSEFQDYRRDGNGAMGSDELFDLAYDFVSNHESVGPFAERDRLYTEQSDAWFDAEGDAIAIGRAWAYALLEAVGEPYRSNPRGGLLRGVITGALALVGAGGIAMGLRARRRG